jgi:hypothetical protein
VFSHPALYVVALDCASCITTVLPFTPYPASLEILALLLPTHRNQTKPHHHPLAMPLPIMRRRAVPADLTCYRCTNNATGSCRALSVCFPSLVSILRRLSPPLSRGLILLCPCLVSSRPACPFCGLFVSIASLSCFFSTTLLCRKNSFLSCSFCILLCRSSASISSSPPPSSYLAPRMLPFLPPRRWVDFFGTFDMA